MNHLHDDQPAIAEVLQQAPPHVDYNDAKLAYYNARRNVSEALASLWNLPPPQEKPKPVGVNAEKWAEVRRTCDEFDAAATEALNGMRRNSAMSSATPATPAPLATVQEIASPLVTIPENVSQEQSSTSTMT